MKVPVRQDLVMQRRRKPTSKDIQDQLYMPHSEIILRCNEIMDLLELGKYTLEECCKAHGIFIRNFRKWVRDDIDVEDYLIEQKEIPEHCISDLNIRYKEVRGIAAVNYADNLKQAARSALSRKVTGYISKEVTETHIIDSATEIIDSEGNYVPNPNFGKLIVSSKRVKMKEEAPDTSAVIFALTNVDKEQFKNRNQITADLPIENESLHKLTESELDAKLAELEKARMDLNID